jgi:hypothetical protein
LSGDCARGGERGRTVTNVLRDLGAFLAGRQGTVRCLGQTQQLDQEPAQLEGCAV